MHSCGRHAHYILGVNFVGTPIYRDLSRSREDPNPGFKTNEANSEFGAAGRGEEVMNMVTRRITRRVNVRIPTLRFTCPHCNYRHEVPGVRLSTPGLMACSRCGRTFNLR